MAVPAPVTPSPTTLSACETAVGDAGAGGREVESFGGLAQRQGAKAVVATLWAVADESTSRFVPHLTSRTRSSGRRSS